MAYYELLAERIRLFLEIRHILSVEKQMMGFLCFMVSNKMFCGLHFNKKKDTDLLMVRIGEPMMDRVNHTRGCIPFDFTGRSMKNFAFITPDGFERDSDLNYWLQLCLTYNRSI